MCIRDRDLTLLARGIQRPPPSHLLCQVRRGCALVASHIIRHSRAMAFQRGGMAPAWGGAAQQWPPRQAFQPPNGGGGYIASNPFARAPVPPGQLYGGFGQGGNGG
eukprot:3084629-Pyramimonas_sp.AAC.1